MNILKTYYQLTKPGIVYGNLITAAAGFLFASKWHIAVRPLAGLLAGVALVIASACVFNNYIDRDIDKHMARTKKRALASGLVPAQSALAYAALLGAAGFGALLLTNPLTMVIGAIGFVDYVALYGIGKRRSVHGTVIGSLSGATPLVAGYTAVTGRFDLAALLLFLIMVCWQMPHFYAIAMYRRDDYAAAKLPVLPVAKSMRQAKIQIVVYVALFTAAAALLTVFGYAGYVFLIGMSAAGLYWLWRGVQGFGAAADARWARKMFGLSLMVMLALSAFLAAGSVLP